jgi:multidrug resistance efflux pump
MSTLCTTDAIEVPAPAARRDLVLSLDATTGDTIVKDRSTKSYFKLGSAESFLLSQLDGQRCSREVCEAFERKFCEPLTADELDSFIEVARGRDLLEPLKPAGLPGGDEADVAAAPTDSASGLRAGVKARQSILYFRVCLFDPDRLLNWLEPKLRFLWTRWFAVAAVCAIATASVIVIANAHELAVRIFTVRTWETVSILWLVVIVATLLHELAHGLTCKHYGGEVHEIGALFMFFMPYLYCNVSDAWMIPEKSKRLWITAAGTFCDMCVWAIAVLVWRLTVQATLVNYVAWAMVAGTLTRILFNFNPLMKLDGYYFLSDLFGVHNLRRRAQERWMGFVRWALWGAKKPAACSRSGLLLTYGVLGWGFSLCFLQLVMAGLIAFFGARLGWLGYVPAMVLAAFVVRRLFRGFFEQEFRAMLKSRPRRATVWAAGMSIVLLLLIVVRINHRASGAFDIRPGQRVEVRATVAGFLREVSCEEGDRLAAGTILARLEVPDLESQIKCKQAEMAESSANLMKLEVGTRPEAIAEQRERVERLERWSALGQSDLQRAGQQLALELQEYDERIAEASTELEFSRVSLAQAETLTSKGAMAGLQFAAEKKKHQIVQSRWNQAVTHRRAREAAGTLAYEAEAARREKELADARSALALLEARGRVEDIEAEKARQARLKEELRYLEDQRSRLNVSCPTAGLVITPRMKEKIGQYLEKGDLVCVIEDRSALVAEVLLNEQDAAGVEPGQYVELKARALPFQTFRGRVERIAASATKEKGDVQSKLVAYCAIEDAPAELSSGMTGFGRIHRPSRPLGMIVTNDLLRWIRTEFWW